MNGYLHRSYAESLAEFGEPIYLPKCEGWILKRPIPGSNHFDAMGCYPLFMCKNWSYINYDLESIKDKLISLYLVTDPFGDFNIENLKQHFDKVFHFKDHFIIDFSKPIDQIVKKSHLASVRRALRRVDVELCENPSEFLDQWVKLYENLVRRHNIKGIRKFSKETFAKQLCVPGTVMFRAIYGGVTVGVDIWYVQGDVAYGHLVALDDIGYKFRASYALKWYILEYFAKKVKWLDLGGRVALGGNNFDGLSQFKKGWSTGVLPVYFCGKVFNQDIYNSLSNEHNSGEIDYFPRYRYGEVY